MTRTDPLFAAPSLAASIDGSEARLSVAVATALRSQHPERGVRIDPIGGGVAVCESPGSPINKLIGAWISDGGERAFDSGALAAVEDGWRALGECVRVELSALARADALAGLGARGYRLDGFEHVLGRRLDDAPPPTAKPADLAIERLAAHDATALQPWMDVLVDGFANPDGTGVAPDPGTREAIAAALAPFAATPGISRWVARFDGEPVGAASARFDGAIALLCGAATLPAFRRRGVQSALLARRLAEARTAGCEIAVMTTAPGTRSQHNGHRHGFGLLYGRAILIAPR